MDIINEFNNWLNTFLMNMGILAPILSTIFIYLEGIFAFLPLVVFVTIDVLLLGPFVGGIVSWIFSTLGCYSTFYLCRVGLHKLFSKFIKNKKSMKKFMRNVDKLKFNQLVMIISIPFSPSILINICAGLSNISLKKYFYALTIGKIFEIVYLVFVGTSLIDCLTNPYQLIKVFVLVIGAYFVGKLLNKHFNMDERF